MPDISDDIANADYLDPQYSTSPLSKVVWYPAFQATITNTGRELQDQGVLFKNLQLDPHESVN